MPKPRHVHQEDGSDRTRCGLPLTEAVANRTYTHRETAGWAVRRLSTERQPWALCSVCWPTIKPKGS
jgi:hypothetical protein